MREQLQRNSEAAESSSELWRTVSEELVLYSGFDKGSEIIELPLPPHADWETGHRTAGSDVGVLRFAGCNVQEGSGLTWPFVLLEDESLVTLFKMLEMTGFELEISLTKRVSASSLTCSTPTKMTSASSCPYLWIWMKQSFSRVVVVLVLPYTGRDGPFCNHFWLQVAPASVFSTWKQSPDKVIPSDLRCHSLWFQLILSCSLRILNGKLQKYITHAF